jgi:hypothetical protein
MESRDSVGGAMAEEGKGLPADRRVDAVKFRDADFC